MGRLDGKIALITGSKSRIGLVTAKRFVNEGAYVFITGRREAELAAAAMREIEKNVTGVQGDVSNLGDLDRLFAQIKREKGKLDIVFANAGVATYAPTANSAYSATKAGGYHGRWRRALKVAFESSSTREVGHAR
jgi:NAD(P)-dependent dehydrogenase (short-subunit alcohol dehydrogenase family)